MSLESINPATGETVETYSAMDHDRVKEILSRVHGSYMSWRETPFEQRAEAMHNAADILRENARSHGELMAREMGKPVSQGRAEAEKCAWVCDYYAEHAEDFLEDDLRETDATRSYVHYQPLGIVLAIMPWNYPFWQVFRFAAPSLMAGNGAVLKHASNVSGCALEIESIFREAGFPRHLFRTLLIGSDAVPRVMRDDRVRAVTLTGSTRAGKAVASDSGSEVKKTVLELGGSDPYLVLEDADLEKTVETCVTSRLLNSGQSCIAAKRFVVHRSRRDAFTERLVKQMEEKRMGDPFEEGVEVGPQARTDLRDSLHRQVTESVEAGATLLTGGEPPEGPGAYYPPTVLDDVGPGMPAYEEELFGPVASVIRANSEQEAIRLANDSDFGLGAAVFTEDVEKGERIARDELEAGCCFVNAYVRSDPRLPFGGVKQSGYGRELSREGIREFVNVKTVYVD